MSTEKKAYERIMQSPTRKDITPDELKSFLARNDFVNVRTNGDHFIFCHTKLNYRLVIPRKNPIKEVYINQVKEAIISLEEKRGNYGI